MLVDRLPAEAGSVVNPRYLVFLLTITIITIYLIHPSGKLKLSFDLIH